MKNPSILKRQEGFTLIEIIAVLVLLGILAAVAVPKYLNLQQEAELRAVEGVRAELMSRANQYYAKYLLNNASTENENTIDLWDDEDLGTDFTLSSSGATLIVTVAASGNTYGMAFTVGDSETDGSGYPASFGDPAVYP